MIIGKIVGKTSTTKFNFKLLGKALKFGYVQVYHDTYGFILCQITEIVKDNDEIAECHIIGYKKDGKILLPRSPLSQDNEVLEAADNFIKEILSLVVKNQAYIGKLDGRNIKIYLDLNKLLSKHIAIIAKTGAGKSYTAGVLIEEILDKKVPLLIIDPHGEYSQIREPNIKEKKSLNEYKLQPKGYKNEINEYGDARTNPKIRSIRLNNEFTPQELLHILPAKLTQSQKALLYSTAKELNPLTLSNLANELDLDNDTSTLNLISIVDYIKSLDIFSNESTPLDELIEPGKCSIINLKGIPPDIAEIIVYKLLKDLFEQRKLGNIPPFFTVIEEAHNFAPERSFGDAKSSQIIRTIASEGRKFGMGLCVITQRPARLDKNVLSQCNTQIILKVTNPGDLKSIFASVENIEGEEDIKNLPIGTALVSGVVDIPLFVNIRPRKSKHGGDTINILEESQGILKNLKVFNKKEILPIIFPKTTPKDIKLMEGKETVSAILIPALILNIEGNKNYSLLVECTKGHIVTDIDTKSTIEIGNFNLSKSQNELIEAILNMKKISIVKLNQKTKISILKLKDFLETFCKMGIITKEKDHYDLTPVGVFLKKPEKFAFIDKISHRQIDYKTKLKDKISEQEIRSKLEFLPIKSTKKCFLVYYKVE